MWVVNTTEHLGGSCDSGALFIRNIQTIAMSPTMAGVLDVRKMAEPHGTRRGRGSMQFFELVRLEFFAPDDWSGV